MHYQKKGKKMHQTLTINQGQRLEFFEIGDFFRLMKAVGPVKIEFYRNGKEIAEAMDVGAGYGERFYALSFDRFAITSQTNQEIQIAARLGGEVWYDTPPIGNVSVVNTPKVELTNSSVEFFDNRVNFTNTTSVQIDAAKPRKYLRIKNEGAVTFFMRFGSNASAGTGIMMTPGEVIVFSEFVPNGAINVALGATANAQVHLLWA
jgi:hypothetical protein